MPWVVEENPTAVHRRLDEQDTAVMPMAFAPVGRRRCWSDQLLPFQCSASPWVGEKSPPTAVQAVATGHDTPASGGLVDWPLIGWRRQLVPSQCSASGPPRALSPTAVQALATGHDTPASPLVTFPVAFAAPGVGWMVQVPARQRIASGAEPGPSSLWPRK